MKKRINSIQTILFLYLCWVTLLFHELQRFNLILGNVYDLEEANNITQLVFEELFEIPPHKQRLDNTRELNTEETSLVRSILGRLLIQEPIQYILGFSWFYGHKFMVNPATLIPRPETEELVSWIIEENKESKSIIDLGSGSGCIAISLAKAIPNAKVLGLDISPGATICAKMNAQKLLNNNSSNTSFIHQDLFDENWWAKQKTFDVMVSNPPYVREKEKSEMRPNVLNHEPHTALFVPDKDPLKYFRFIGEKAQKHLNPKGALYLEINSALGEETCQMLSALGFEVTLRKDLQGKDRMVRARKRN